MLVEDSDRKMRSAGDHSTIPETFFSDVEKLSRAQRTHRNSYITFIQQETKKRLKGKWSMSDLSNRYRLLTEEEKEHIRTQGLADYIKKYDSLCKKYARQKLIIPKFLDPNLSSTSPISIAHRDLWKQLMKDRNAIKDAATLDKEFSVFKNRRTKSYQKELRVKYNFHNDFTFIHTTYFLYLAHERRQNPDKSMKEIITGASDWRSTLTDIQVANFEKQSKRRKAKYDKQNKQASLEALHNSDWMALKVSCPRNTNLGLESEFLVR